MILICGIHGVGKSNYAKLLKNNTDRDVYIASELICGKGYSNSNKEVEAIDKNQQKLLDELNKKDSSNAILVGHTCLLNASGHIQRVDISYFKQMDIESIYIVVDKAECIRDNLLHRDNAKWKEIIIHRFQNEEIRHAKEIAKECGVPYHMLYEGKEVTQLDKVVKDSIILPIKPIYSDMILVGKKKYEYRKKLCRKDIEKIYIYSTSPIKKIVGEADVLEKIEAAKEELWENSKDESGITKEFYDQYFCALNNACAYKLGKIKRYDMGVELEDIGMDYSPQSYVYVSGI